jgi:hypothetical protein
LTFRSARLPIRFAARSRGSASRWAWRAVVCACEWIKTWSTDCFAKSVDGRSPSQKGPGPTRLSPQRSLWTASAFALGGHRAGQGGSPIVALKLFADVRSNSLQAGGPTGGRRVLRITITSRKHYNSRNSGGGGRTRTYEGLASGFTVRPLCHSGHSPMSAGSSLADENAPGWPRRVAARLMLPHGSACQLEI